MKSVQPNPLLKRQISLGRITLGGKALFAKNVAVMLSAGLTLVESLDSASDAAGGRLKKIIGKVKESVQSGSSFAAALEEYPHVFGGIFVSAVYAGERSGNLATNLSNLAEVLEKERELESKIKSAMTYPLIVLILAMVLGLLLAFVLLPKITPLFAGLSVDLPLSTRVLIWFSDLVQHRGAEILIGLVVGLVGLGWLVRRQFTSRVRHWLLLNLPFVKKIVISTNLSRLARTLALLLKSGLNVDESLEITKRTIVNHFYKENLGLALADVSQGLKLSENLGKNTKLFPPLFVRVVRVGEGSGKLEDSFNYLADYYGGEADQSTKSFSTALEPILLIGIGLVVASLALAIITPIYELTGNVRR